MGREGQHGKWLVLRAVEEQQLHRDGPLGVDGEIHSAGDRGGAVDLIKARPHVKACDIVQRDQVDGPGKADLVYLLGDLGGLRLFHRNRLPYSIL